MTKKQAELLRKIRSPLTDAVQEIVTIREEVSDGCDHLSKSDPECFMCKLFEALNIEYGLLKVQEELDQQLLNGPMPWQQ